MTLSETSEAELLGLMAAQRAAPSAAQAAWDELYRRHSRYVFAVIARAYGQHLGGDDGVRDLVIDTFQRAYEWTGRQNGSAQVEERFQSPDPDACRRRVLGWLAAIAAHLFKDRLRQRRSSPQELAVAADLPSREPGEASLLSSPRLGQLNLILSELSPKDAEALRVSLLWYDPATRKFAVPTGEAARIAHSLGTTPEGLRQRRHRALKYIRQRMNATPPPQANAEHEQ